MIRFCPLAALSALTLLPTTLPAQDEIDTGEEEVRQYQVELVVFRYAESVATGTEIFLPDEPEVAPLVPPVLITPVYTDVQPLESVVEAAPAEEIPLDELPTEPEFLLAPPGEFGLQDVLDKLGRSSVYDPLFSASWVQDALEEEESITMDLDMLGVPPDVLEGSFELYLSRFLHLIVDLDYTPRSGPLLPVEIEIPDGAETPGKLSYRIDEDRIFRSGETRYFDHPKFGVVARITRIEEPDDPLAEEAIDDLVGQ